MLFKILEYMQNKNNNNNNEDEEIQNIFYEMGYLNEIKKKEIIIIA